MVFWKWLARKLKALLMAVVVISLLMGTMTFLDGTFDQAYQVMTLTALFAPFYGLFPALLVTALSDRFAANWKYPRKWTALGIHLLGGCLFLFSVGPYWGWLGVVAAFVFWATDECLRPVAH